MTKLISDRLSAQAPALVAAFAAVRARVRDSGIKGSENEAIVHGFLEEHLSGGTIAERAEICDSYDRVANPLRHYFGTHRPFPTWGLEPIDGPSQQPPMDTPGPTP